MTGLHYVTLKTKSEEMCQGRSLLRQWVGQDIVLSGLNSFFLNIK